MEVQLEIGPGCRWTPQMPQYISTIGYISEWRYHWALDELQRLVVMRLFELNTINLAQTGESQFNINSFLRTGVTSTFARIQDP